MAEKLIEVKNLKKYFNTKKGLLHAVDDVNFYINKGETLGLVGESGCGKSTTGRVLLRLLEATAGEVLFEGNDILKLNSAGMRDMRKQMQIVFQDPFASLNPRLSLSEIIAEPLIVNKVYNNKADMNKKVKELMDTVGLAQRLINTYPHELDGGRRQRIGIARALALNPKFIVQDEPVSALDVSIQAQILNLMADLQDEFGLTYLFISHDLSVVKHVSSRIAVMYLGKIVEMSDYNSMFKDPLHPYTQALLSAIPVPSLEVHKEKIILEGDVPSPINPPEGCRFYGRCRHRQDICLNQSPELREIEPERFVACHFARNLK
ncbi:peptide/nickel transport system ATP-binding protein [Acetoanaerobium pronyense]|uniref:Peptide/nickel transport system ATP-binding protein n=1 Tax=Acetoanaerobium pronyense TaxID=1482736 RepID=A0ABS4KF03_9FIRM|nr:ABC transporter ATP-binding protein [Acetoanaerobium pronyense]MBP2026333.1 peptide/nickel transport system ATP-binding protein [Acetoanaerobium pronyense]